MIQRRAIFQAKSASRSVRGSSGASFRSTPTATQDERDEPAWVVLERVADAASSRGCTAKGVGNDRARSVWQTNHPLARVFHGVSTAAATSLVISRLLASWFDHLASRFKQIQQRTVIVTALKGVRSTSRRDSSISHRWGGALSRRDPRDPDRR